MDYKVAIIGLGYVGLPLAVESGKLYPTIGFDISLGRVNELENGEDKTLEVTSEELIEAKYLSYTVDSADLQDCNFYIVTVPTPIDSFKNPSYHDIFHFQLGCSNRFTNRRRRRFVFYQKHGN